MDGTVPDHCITMVTSLVRFHARAKCDAPFWVPEIRLDERQTRALIWISTIFQLTVLFDSTGSLSLPETNWSSVGQLQSNTGLAGRQRDLVSVYIFCELIYTMICPCCGRTAYGNMNDVPRWMGGGLKIETNGSERVSILPYSRFLPYWDIDT